MVRFSGRPCLNSEPYFISMLRYLPFLLATIVLFSCGKDNPPISVKPVEQEPKVDKTAFIASLLAGRKYWRFEELTVEQPNYTRKFNLIVDSTGTLPVVATTVVSRHTAFRFDDSGKLLPDQVDSGPYGNIPYTPKSGFAIFIPGYSYPGSWYWDEKRETVAIKGLSGISLMIDAISKTKKSPEIGYVDNTMPAKYKTLNQAITGASPDRIRIIFYEDDPEIGTIKYIFTMRAAWVTKIIELRSRTELYEVLY